MCAQMYVLVGGARRMRACVCVRVRADVCGRVWASAHSDSHRSVRVWRIREMLCIPDDQQVEACVRACVHANAEQEGIPGVTWSSLAFPAVV